MAFRQHEDLTEVQIRAFLKDAVSKVKEHPEEYEDYKRIFKEETGLTTRNFVAAYILKQASGAIYRFNKFKDNGDEFRPRRRFERTAESDSKETTETREFKSILTLRRQFSSVSEKIEGFIRKTSSVFSSALPASKKKESATSRFMRTIRSSSFSRTMLTRQSML